MKTHINNELIRSFSPCYDPSELGIPDTETLTVKEWVEKYKDKVNSKKGILWLLLRPEFLSDKDLRLFAVWCAREALKLVEHPDPRSINAVDTAERFANGEATAEELSAAWAAASAAAWVAAWAAASAAAWVADGEAAWGAAWGAAWAAAWVADGEAASAAAGAARDAQIEKLLTYF